MKREFLLTDDEGRNVDVVATLGAGAGGYFSLTCNNGAAHERILSAATDEVRDDLQALAAVHLADRNGTPMHAIENAAYHVREHRFAEAASTLDADIDIREIYELHAKATLTLMGPSSLIETRTKQVLEQIKAVQQAKSEFERDERLRERIFAAPERLHRAITRLSALLAGNEPGFPERTSLQAQKTAIAAFEKANAPLLRQAPHELTEHVRKRLTPILTAKVFRELVVQYAVEKCAPVWAARAEAARAALEKPSYRLESRPDPSVDPRTFEGFCASHGISMNVVSRGSSLENRRRRFDWECSFRKEDGTTYSTKFFTGRDLKPTVADVLSCLQSDFASAEGVDQDAFISELGYDTSLPQVREGERIYATIQTSLTEFREAFGEDTYTELLTSVGDDPPRFYTASPRM